MSSTQHEDIARFRQAVEQLAHIQNVRTHIGMVDTICLETVVGDLCVLIVPNRSEIEVWLTSTNGNEELRYPISTLQQALGLESRALLYSSKSIDSSLQGLSSLLEDFLRQANANPQQFKRKLQLAYDEMVENSLLGDKRTSAEELWSLGRYQEAAQIYREIPSLSKIEAKRLELITSGKMPG